MNTSDIGLETVLVNKQDKNFMSERELERERVDLNLFPVSVRIRTVG